MELEWRSDDLDRVWPLIVDKPVKTHAGSQRTLSNSLFIRMSSVVADCDDSTQTK
jgi:hypothetical protein